MKGCYYQNKAILNLKYKLKEGRIMILKNQVNKNVKYPATYVYNGKYLMPSLYIFEIFEYIFDPHFI